MHTILHLTDLHFGWEGDAPSGLADRKVCLNGLLKELRQLEKSWKPSVVCLTGDIAWRGTAEDYNAAKVWLDQVLAILELTYNSVIVCPGNHDVFRPVAKKLARPESASEADEVLAPPVASHLESPFKGFLDFCKTAEIPTLNFGNEQSHLVGERAIDGLRFVVLNSAWFCKDNFDKEKLWMGMPHLRFMEAHGQLDLSPDLTTITLLHHPQEWLHGDEIHATGGRPNAFDYLAHRCHLILTGHTHGEVRRADRIADHALHFTGGSTYAGASHFNSFRIIRINHDLVEDRTFEFDPRSPQNAWRSAPAGSRPLTHAVRPIPVPLIPVALVSTGGLRDACRKHAHTHLEIKSRLVRRDGPLPSMVQRPVAVRVSAQIDQFDPSGKFVRSKDAEQSMPFFEAVRHSRRTILLGDLGTGKSTLAAHLVIETLERSTAAVALFLPVKALRLEGRFTQRELLKQIAKYVSEDIWLLGGGFDLESILNQRTEVLLVLDGLDELARDIATRLLQQAAAIVENWANSQVVATARPIELKGTSYSNWRVAHTISLDDAGKREFLRQELLIDGVSAEEADGTSEAMLRTLKEAGSLDLIANSPLAIRLIYPRLAAFTSNTELTLGDLLFEVLVERLDGWQKRDDKPNEFQHLEDVLPTADARAEYLSVLAERAALGKRILPQEAKTLLQDAAAFVTGANRSRLAEEGLSFFGAVGLLSISDTVDFPLQPLAEVCAAAGLTARWRSDLADASMPERRAWRIVSFAAALARRSGTMAALRDRFATAIKFLLSEEGYVPAACYIVVESGEKILAEEAIQLFGGLRYRPLTYFLDERRVSARNIAKTLHLAGNNGFAWFYANYLDPRYPIPNAGCAVVTDVLTEWAGVVNGRLTPKQKEQLAALVLPYEATGEGHVYGILTILSVLVPNSFSPEDRFRYQSLALERPLFSNWVKEQFRHAQADGELKAILGRVLSFRCGEGVIAARLRLEFSQAEDPSYSIIRLALRSLCKTNDPDATMLVNECKKRLGDDRWTLFARWALATEERPLNAGAAQVIYETGDQRLSVIGDALIEAMHDGAYIAVAEKILGALVKLHSERGVHWVAHRIREADRRMGAHSGWWRVLLESISTVEDGPTVLASCARSLGPFTLPRYPEVREGFVRVLKGSRGPAFHEALRANLRSLDPLTRQGAAAILVSSDPQNEAEALFVAVRSRASRRGFELREWESFCLTLNFGPTVLSFLKSKLLLLDPKTRALALVLLEKSGIHFEADYRKELMTTLNALDNWHLCREPIGQELLGADEAFIRLSGDLDEKSSEVSQRAAEHLLEFHLPRLDLPGEAKCMALRHGSSGRTWELEADLGRISREPGFAAALIDVGHEIFEKRGYVPLLCKIATAITVSGDWKDVVWSLLGDDTAPGGASESDSGGMALLEFGFNWPKHRNGIGTAAKECLEDPRIKQTRWHDAYHWLALLADEFCGLDPAILRSVILHGQPIHCAATTALIGRLGEVPEGFVCNRSERRRPQNPEQEKSWAGDTASLTQELKDLARDSNVLHPAIIKSVEKCLFIEPFDEEILDSIALVGKPGILISVLLRFVYGRAPKLAQAIPLLDVWSKIWADERNKPEWTTLSQAWKILRGATILEDDRSAGAYVTSLDRALIAGDTWKLALAWELLEIRGSLTDAEIPLVLEEFSEHPTFLHDGLFAMLCIFLSGEISENTKTVLGAAAEHGITQLDEAPWHPDTGAFSNPWANLLFPTLIWAYGNEMLYSLPAQNVFLRGIRELFERLPDSQSGINPLRVIGRLEPLLSKVPPKFIGAVTRHGMDSLEPTVSTFCRMINALNTHSQSLTERTRST